MSEEEWEEEARYWANSIYPLPQDFLQEVFIRCYLQACKVRQEEIDRLKLQGALDFADSCPCATIDESEEEAE